MAARSRRGRRCFRVIALSRSSCSGTCALVDRRRWADHGRRRPARVADSVIAEIRSRERDGLVELPKRGLVPGDRVRVTTGPLRGFDGLYAGMRPRERVLVLLAVLGSQRRVLLPRDDIERT
jgi:transcription antitermination factor NusG